MYTFFIQYHHPVDPLTGQQKLEHMKSAIQGQHTTWAGGVLKLPGVTPFINPYPQWFNDIMRGAGCVYDDINMSWARGGLDYHQVIAFLQWFEQGVRPWILSDHQWFEWQSHVTSRGIQSDDVEQSLDNF